MRPADAKTARDVRALLADIGESGGCTLQVTGPTVCLWETGSGRVIELPRESFQRLVEWWQRDQPAPCARGREAQS